MTAREQPIILQMTDMYHYVGRPGYGLWCLNASGRKAGF